MRFRRSDRSADRTESDRILDAARAGQPTDAADEPLARLLSAAAAPARPGELAGEREALAAFRAARAAPAPTPANPRRRGLTTGAVAWIAGLAATATAGAAFAAVTLDRPEEPAPPPRPTTPAPGPSDREPGGSPSHTGGGTPTSGAPSRTGAAPSSGPTPTRDGGASKPGGAAQVPGLCRAYLAKKPTQRARALEEPGFAPLVSAAGGAAEVDGFCRRLVPEPGARAATPEPRASRSAAAPTGAPSDD